MYTVVDQSAIKNFTGILVKCLWILKFFTSESRQISSLKYPTAPQNLCDCCLQASSVPPATHSGLGPLISVCCCTAYLIFIACLTLLISTPSLNISFHGKISSNCCSLLHFGSCKNWGFLKSCPWRLSHLPRLWWSRWSIRFICFLTFLLFFFFFFKFSLEVIWNRPINYGLDSLTARGVRVWSLDLLKYYRVGIWLYGHGATKTILILCCTC